MPRFAFPSLWNYGTFQVSDKGLWTVQTHEEHGPCHSRTLSNRHSPKTPVSTKLETHRESQIAHFWTLVGAAVVAHKVAHAHALRRGHRRVVPDAGHFLLRSREEFVSRGGMSRARAPETRRERARTRAHTSSAELTQSGTHEGAHTDSHTHTRAVHNNYWTSLRRRLRSRARLAKGF